VVVVEVPQGSKHATCICQAFKEYFFHVQLTSSVHEASFLDPKQLTHYCDPPFEAAFTGVFLHEAALRMYFSLFDSLEAHPFMAETLSRNKSRLLSRARQELSNSAFCGHVWKCKRVDRALHMLERLQVGTFMVYNCSCIMNSCSAIACGMQWTPIPGCSVGDSCCFQDSRRDRMTYRLFQIS
jgi:hypothetical protein